MKECPNCGTSNGDNVVFCSTCGRKIGSLNRVNSITHSSSLKFCVSCGKRLTEGVKFCENCGERVMEDENPTPMATPVQETPVSVLNPSSEKLKEMTVEFTELAANLDKAAFDAEITIVNFNWDNKDVLDEINSKFEELSASDENYELVIKFENGPDVWDVESSLFEENDCVKEYYLPVSVYKFTDSPDDYDLEKMLWPELWEKTTLSVGETYKTEKKQFPAGTYEFTVGSDSNGARLVTVDAEKFENECDFSKFDDGASLASAMDYSDCGAEIYDGLYVPGSTFYLTIDKTDDEEDPRFPMRITFEGDSGIYAIDSKSEDGNKIYVAECNIITDKVMGCAHYEALYNWNSYGTNEFELNEGFNITDIIPYASEFENVKLDEEVCDGNHLFTGFSIITNDNNIFIGDEGEPIADWGYVVKVDEDGNTDWLYD